MMISHAYPPTFGGVESHVWDISHRLLNYDHDVLVVTGGVPVPTPGRVPAHRHRVLSVSTLLGARAGRPRTAPPQPRLLAELRTVLGRELDAFRPDLVHVHNAHHYGPELARALLDRAAVPVLNGVHDRVGEYLYPDVLDWPWDLVVYVSRYLRAALPTRRPAAVRWLGIELDTFRPDGPRDPRLERLPGPVVFHPARLLRWKGVECGVRAFARVHRELGGALVLCASDDIVDDPREVAAFRRELGELAGQLGVGDAVHFMSFDRLRIADAYRAADLIWYPTIDDEPLGLVPMEAMACGVPVVVSRSGGMTETVVAGETGLVVPRDDAGALAAAARAILTDAALRAALVRGGRARSARFGNAGYVDWLDASYRALAGTPVRVGASDAGR
jgi:glycosyltransferase involved in cell wall biosynthesis